MNQEELGIERFTLAIALNNQQIEEQVQEFKLEGEEGQEEPEQT